VKWSRFIESAKPGRSIQAFVLSEAAY